MRKAILAVFILLLALCFGSAAQRAADHRLRATCLSCSRFVRPWHGFF